MLDSLFIEEIYKLSNNIINHHYQTTLTTKQYCWARVSSKEREDHMSPR